MDYTHHHAAHAAHAAGGGSGLGSGSSGSFGLYTDPLAAGTSMGAPRGVTTGDPAAAAAVAAAYQRSAASFQSNSMHAQAQSQQQHAHHHHQLLAQQQQQQQHAHQQHVHMMRQQQQQHGSVHHHSNIVHHMPNVQNGGVPLVNTTGQQQQQKKSPSDIVVRQLHKVELCVFHNTPGMVCKKGANCPFAHSVAELQARPNLEKTAICPKVKRGQECRNPNCKFAHKASELRYTDETLRAKADLRNQQRSCSPLMTGGHNYGSPGLGTAAAQSSMAYAAALGVGANQSLGLGLDTTLAGNTSMWPNRFTVDPLCTPVAGGDMAMDSFGFHTPPAHASTGADKQHVHQSLGLSEQGKQLTQQQAHGGQERSNSFPSPSTGVSSSGGSTSGLVSPLATTTDQTASLLRRHYQAAGLQQLLNTATAASGTSGNPGAVPQSSALHSVHSVGTKLMNNGVSVDPAAVAGGAGSGIDLAQLQQADGTTIAKTTGNVLRMDNLENCGFDMTTFQGNTTSVHHVAADDMAARLSALASLQTKLQTSDIKSGGQSPVNVVNMVPLSQSPPTRAVPPPPVPSMMSGGTGNCGSSDERSHRALSFNSSNDNGSNGSNDNKLDVTAPSVFAISEQGSSQPGSGASASPSSQLSMQSAKSVPKSPEQEDHRVVVDGDNVPSSKEVTVPNTLQDLERYQADLLQQVARVAEKMRAVKRASGSEEQELAAAAVVENKKEENGAEDCGEEKEARKSNASYQSSADAAELDLKNMRSSTVSAKSQLD